MLELARNEEKANMVTTPMEILVYGIDTLVELQGDDVGTREYLRKIGSITSAAPKQLLRAPLIRDTMIDGAQISDWFRRNEGFLCNPGWMADMMGAISSDVSTGNRWRQTSLTRISSFSCSPFEMAYGR